MSKRRLVLTLILGLLLLVVLSGVVFSQPLSQERGRAVLSATGRDNVVLPVGQSPHLRASPFSVVSKRHPVEHPSE